jgi:hypothetical protein
MTATDRPFTVVVCAGCYPPAGWSVLDELRGSIRRCTHGLLVTAASHDGPGTVIILKPCTRDRSPLGPARWVGPVIDRRDAARVCDWVERGEWDIEELPRRLRVARNDVRVAAALN